MNSRVSKVILETNLIFAKWITFEKLFSTKNTQYNIFNHNYFLLFLYFCRFITNKSIHLYITTVAGGNEIYYTLRWILR